VKVAFELLALFRQKAGADRLELDVPVGACAPLSGEPGSADAPTGLGPDGGEPAGADAPTSLPGYAPTVLAALRAAEDRLGGQPLLDGEKLRQGVLVFLKDSRGAARRVFHPAEERVRSGQTVVLSTAMGGG
jgi:hypothetical protein